MRNRFDTQLMELNNQLISMGALCENAIAGAVKSLLTGDQKLAAAAIRIDQEIDQREREIESMCLKLLLQQQPVARDLRLISAVLKSSPISRARAAITSISSGWRRPPSRW